MVVGREEERWKNSRMRWCLPVVHAVCARNLRVDIFGSLILAQYISRERRRKERKNPDISRIRITFGINRVA